MPNENDPNNKERTADETAPNDPAVKGSSSDTIGGGATATGRSMQNHGSTGTEIQDPGTSRQEENVIGRSAERSTQPQNTIGQPIRNPSGDDISDAADGDEGSGRNF